MKAKLNEDCLVEQPTINCLKDLGYTYILGSELCPENGERESYRDVILKKRFISAISKTRLAIIKNPPDTIRYEFRDK